MGGNGEIQNMISSIMKGFWDMTRNIILYGKETREFLVKHLENKNGEGSSCGS